MEKIIEELAVINTALSALDQNLSDLQQRLSLGVPEAKADYDLAVQEFHRIRLVIHKLQTMIEPAASKPYILFVDLKSCFNCVKNKIETTRYLKVLFTRIYASPER